VNALGLTLARQSGARITYPRGWKAELTWVDATQSQMTLALAVIGEVV